MRRESKQYILASGQPLELDYDLISLIYWNVACISKSLTRCSVWYTIVRDRHAWICMTYPDVIPIRGRCSSPQVSSLKQAMKLPKDHGYYLAA